jgi:hypothetical protein
MSQTTFPSLCNDAQVATHSGSIEMPAALESAARCIPLCGLVQSELCREPDYAGWYDIRLRTIGFRPGIIRREWISHSKGRESTICALNDSGINFICEVRGAHMRRPAQSPHRTV